MTLYDIPDEVILKATRMSKNDIKFYLKNKNYEIRTFEDLIDELKGNGLLEEELNGRTIEEFKEDLRNDQYPYGDSGILEYDGKEYEYVVYYVL